ncbi:SDR family oxidoreductase [Aquibium sp. A9E412]|uniref:SDR family NAD(P)-dependent oxidoreductase n=1 Tax=Aquibium sp. A9E412 TaxID=2976767 RepID=UPI0025B24DD4|nr:SDR family NAD(P)-dependent oxidoreductase [Aquibium sp. A9E412]MDN2566661.1 SDR family oxidoreductase [Aquibium sp. A9E412]
MTDTLPPVADLLDLSGRTALVTGAGGGIGAGIARRLAAAGAAVALHYNASRAAAERLAEEIGAAGGRAAAFAADIADPAACPALLGAVAERLGEPDILVNNAGVQPVEAFEAIAPDSLRAMMDANLGGPFALVQAFAARLAEAGDRPGAVVNIASIEGLQPAPGHSHYAASKAALIMFTRAAAMELGPRGIRVNAVSPGLIHRDGIEEGWPEGVARWRAAAPLGRLGRPEDIGDAVLFLASDAARWITGANLVVDGGVGTRPTW